MGKLKLNKDGIKGFFINHVEKMVLVMVLLVFGLFVYSSLGLEGLPASQTPDALKQSAESAEKKIIDPANSKEVLASVTISSGYRKRVDDGLIPTQFELYAAAKPVSPSYGQDGMKRQDPKLLAPEKVEVYPASGPIAYRMTSLDEDALFKEENSVAKPKVEPKKASPKKKRGEMDPYGAAMGMDGGMDAGSGMGGMEGYAAGMGGKGGASAGMDAGMPGMSGMAGMSGMPGMSGMSGMPGMAGAAGMTASVTANMQDRIGFMAGQGAVARSQNFIAVKAVVPWKRQWEEFDQKFSTAMGFNPMRDTPRYVSFTAERLEVTDDPAAPLDWSKATKVAFTNRLRTEIQTAGYYGFPQELADPRYLQFGVLAFPVPPVMNRDLEPLALHHDVPKLAQAAIDEMKSMMAKVEEYKKKELEKRKKAGEEEFPADAPQSGVPGQAGGYGGAGMPGMAGAGMGGDAGMAGMGMAGMGMAGMGMPGMGMPGMSGDAGMGMSGMPGDAGMGMPGMGMPGMGMPGMGMPGMSGMGMGEDSGKGMGMPGMEMSGMGMSGMGMSGMGMSGMGDGSTMGGTRGPAVPYLLVRFFDFSAEEGKKYRYRVQVILEDPNHPMFPQLEPSDRYLDDTVKKRLGQVSADEKSTKKRVYFLRTDWSEPSDPVGIDIKTQSFAGHVMPVRTALLPEKTQDKIIVDEPAAKVMSVMWDPTFAVDVTAVSDVFRGTFLNFTTDGDAIHPVYLVYKSLKKYNFATNRLVADIRGGEELPGADKPLTPGQYALVDDNGQIIIRNELDDWESLRKLALPELPDPAMGGFPGMDGGMPGKDGEMGMPGMGMPGMEGKGKKDKGGRGGRSSSDS